MKYSYYFAVAAFGSLMLASCSNDEVISTPDAPTQAIEFKAMANKSTRADVNTASLDRFRVYGCNMDAGTNTNHVSSFDFVYVEKNEDGTWSYNDVQYWAPNKDYYFVALSTNTSNRAWSFTAPTTHDVALSTTDFKGYGTVTMNITKEIENADDADADQDLVYAYAARTTDDDITNSSKINFTFYHMLSRLAFTFKNTFANANYSFQISNVQIGGLINEASCTLGVDPTNLIWTPTESNQPVQVNVTLPEGATATTANPIRTSKDYTYIIPGGQAISISFDVTVLLGGKIYSVRTLNGTIAAATYEPGKSYMLTAEINQDNIIEGGAKPIEFNVTSVNGWDTNEEGNITFN